jgi:hypothetical protein
MCVPLIVQWVADLLDSRISFSTVQCRSGKAVRREETKSLSPVRLAGIPQAGIWVMLSGVKSWSTIARSPRLNASSKSRRTRDWVAGTPYPLDNKAIPIISGAT